MHARSMLGGDHEYSTMRRAAECSGCRREAWRAIGNTPILLDTRRRNEACLPCDAGRLSLRLKQRKDTLPVSRVIAEVFRQKRADGSAHCGPRWSAYTCQDDRTKGPNSFAGENVLPLGKGVVLDPFAGSGSTLSACEAVGYESVGVERDRKYFDLATEAIPKLSKLAVEPD